MPSVRPPSSSSKWPYYSCYLALSAVAVYYMRLSPPSQLTGKLLEPLFTSSAAFAYPGHPNVPIRMRYTGIAGLDTFLGMLVTAFLAGPAQFAKHIQIQQANFLFNFAPYLVIISTEAVRSRKWSLVVFTSLWASLYQTVGGAIVIPLYFIAHGRAFGKPDGARLVPAAWAKTLLPAVVLGYLLPTALMYYPFKDINHTMLATAFWQPSPILLNAVWAILSRISSGRGVSSGHLRSPLVLTGLIASALHIGTLYACFSRSHPTVTLSSIFVPRESLAASFQDATHFVFQVDYAIIFLSTTLWCLQTRAEDRAAAGKAGSKVVDVVLLASSVALLGPGATLSWVWYGRQGRAGLKSA